MKVTGRVVAAACILALGAAPAFAARPDQPGSQGRDHANTTQAGPPSSTPQQSGQPSSTPPSNQGTANKPSTPGPHASLPAKARAYGRKCQGESKKHVKGQRGTPFSKCVTDMAKIAKGTVTNPTTACKNESKKHVKGEHGTPYSRCVSAAAKLLRQQRS